MLRTAKRLRNPLEYIGKMTKNEEYLKIQLTENDWLIIDHLISIFEVFVKTTVKLQGQLYTTLPISLLYIYVIHNKLKALKDEFNELQNDRQATSTFISNL